MGAGAAGGRVLVLLTAVALVLRAHRLTLSGLSLDEAVSVALAQRSFTAMLELFRFEANGTLFQVLLWPVVQLTESPAAVRAPALLLGVLCVPALYWAGVQLTSRRAALAGAGLFAVHPFAIELSQQARYYTAAMLFVTLSVGLLVRALRNGSALSWALYVLSVVASVYAMALSAVVLAVVHSAVIAARRGEARGALHPLVAACVAVLGAVAPQLYLLGVAAQRRDALYHLTAPDLRHGMKVLGVVLTGSRPSLEAAFVLLVLAGAMGATLAARLRGRAAVSTGPLCVWLAWGVVPVVLLFAISQARPMFADRYVLAAVPGACLLSGELLARGPRKIWTIWAAGVAVALTVPAVQIEPRFSDYATAARWVAERPSDGALLVIPMERLPALAYYDKSLRGPNGLIPVEEWGDVDLPAGVTGFKLPGGYGRVPVGPPSAAQVAATLRNGAVRVVFFGEELREEVREWARVSCRAEYASFRLLEAASFSSCEDRGPGVGGQQGSAPGR